MTEPPAAGHSSITRARQALARFYCRRMEEREDRLAAMTTDRVVRQFEWGLDWTRGWPDTADVARDGDSPVSYLARLNESALGRSSRFFGYRTPSDFRLDNSLL
jgi:hypothetical protein